MEYGSKSRIYATYVIESPAIKGKCIFNESWLDYKEWVAKDLHGNKHAARCKLCIKTILIGTSGRFSLDSHIIKVPSGTVVVTHLFVKKILVKKT